MVTRNLWSARIWVMDWLCKGKTLFDCFYRSGFYSWSFLRFKVDLSSWKSLYLIELDHINFNVGLFGFSLSCLVSRGARATTSSGDGEGYLSCLMCEVLWVFWKGFLNLKIKLWLMFRSPHLVLWLLRTYGLRESG